MDWPWLSIPTGRLTLEGQVFGAYGMLGFCTTWTYKVYKSKFFGVPTDTHLALEPTLPYPRRKVEKKEKLEKHEMDDDMKTEPDDDGDETMGDDDDNEGSTEESDIRDLKHRLENIWAI